MELLTSGRPSRMERSRGSNMCSPPGPAVLSSVMAFGVYGRSVPVSLNSCSEASIRVPIAAGAAAGALRGGCSRESCAT